MKESRIVVSLILLLVIVLGLMGCPATRPSKEGAQATITISRETVAAPPKPPTPEAFLKPPEIEIASLSRDLFIPLATQVEPVEPPKPGKIPGLPTGPPTGVQPSPPAAYITSYIRLTGIMNNEHTMAIVEYGGNNYIVQQGDTIEGIYKVISLSDKSAVLMKDGKKINLVLGGG